MPMLHAALLALALAVSAAPVKAEEFQPISEETLFRQLIDGRDLTRFGIRLAVLPGGEIRGKAFGRAVSGAWRWSEGFFCRDLFWGERDLGPNCQMVKVSGDVLRFVSDRGDGIYADLWLK